jgi:hypothetical protein
MNYSIRKRLATVALGTALVVLGGHMVIAAPTTALAIYGALVAVIGIVSIALATW